MASEHAGSDGGPLPNETIRRLVDFDGCTVSPRIFWDETIYRQELERIFARCWIFVCHDSQVSEIGDFLTTRIGEDGVIVTRGKEGKVHCFLNACPHRGNRICFAEAGSKRRFTCNYHGWSFGLDGTLLGMPAENLYQTTARDFEKSRHSPIKARVENYKGLNFATFDNEAPSLDEFLGDFRWYLDVLLDNDVEGTEFLDGNVKSRIACNWKIPAENFVGDSYHAVWTHNSGAVAIFGKGVGVAHQERTYQANVNGHGWQFGLDLVGNAKTLGEPEIVEYLREREAVMAERLGALRARLVGAQGSATVFPNFSFLPGHNAFRTWNPVGAHTTELHTWVLVNRSAPKRLKEMYRRGVMRTFSPSGMLEMDDGENWEHATATAAGVVTQRQRLYYGLGSDSRIEHDEFKGALHLRKYNDSNQMAFYRRWADLMLARNWRELADNGVTMR